ncbi:thiaminase II [Acetobacteraceae bacterium]|nr:thiaminase II [Acetobacteraceae bacterium]
MKSKLFATLFSITFLLPSFSFATSQHRPFSEEAWEKIAPLYEKIRNHPFNQELEKGTLEKKKFDFYAAQDAYYLKNYAKSFELLAAKLENPKDAQLALAFASDALQEQIDQWHKKTATQPAPATLLYTNFELSVAALKSPEETAATLLPCFWIYAVLGDELSKNATSPNPYENWLKDYGNPKFHQDNEKMKALVNRLAENASPALRQKMLEDFVMTSKMELNFWDAAYKLQDWP